MKSITIALFWVVLSGQVFCQNSYPTITTLDLKSLPAGATKRCWYHMGENGLGQPILIPLIIIRGTGNGPVLGIEAAIHGNELNGIAVIHRLIQGIDSKTLNGTIIAVPAVNVPGLINEDRLYQDQEDLNRIMPGSATGNESQIYANRYLTQIASQFNYLIDLHTASFGRINTNYVRADLSDPKMADLARLQNADIILNSKEASTTGGSGTIRSSLTSQGIATITIELGNPQVFQYEMIERGVVGLENTLTYLGMTKKSITKPSIDAVVCKKSYWIYTDTGGLLDVLPDLNANISKGEKIAILRNAFGETIKEYHAQEAGVVIGKSSNPVTPTGGRILHLGILDK